MSYAQPPGAAALCAGCGGRLIACYPDQQLHPQCDPDPPVWTEQTLAAYWAARDAQTTTERSQP